MASDLHNPRSRPPGLSQVGVFFNPEGPPRAQAMVTPVPKKIFKGESP